MSNRTAQQLRLVVVVVVVVILLPSVTESSHSSPSHSPDPQRALAFVIVFATPGSRDLDADVHLLQLHLSQCLSALFQLALSVANRGERHL